MPTATRKEKKGVSESIAIPEGVEVSIRDGAVTVRGAKGEVKKRLVSVGISINVKNGSVEVAAKKDSKRERKVVGSFIAHIKNMFKGVTQGYVYRLKICSGHFPMNVSVSGQEFIIKNLLGEKTPRKLRLNPGVSVKVSGNEVIVEGVDKDAVSQCSASIEQLAKRANYDRRIFQDGIFIVAKDEKELM